MKAPSTRNPEQIAEQLAGSLDVPGIHDFLEVDDGKWDRLIKALAADMPAKDVLTLNQEVGLQRQVQAAIASNSQAAAAFKKLCDWQSLRESLTMEAAYAVGLAVGRRNGGAR